jgi:hypothetical protein
MRRARLEQPRRGEEAARAVLHMRWARRVSLAGEIVLAHVEARRALHRAPIAEVVEGLRGRPARVRRRSRQSPLAEARDLASAVSRTLALLPGDTRCLARSLVLTRLLARRAIPAKLVIGAHASPEFVSHAWVEHAGHPVLSPGQGSVERLVEL